MGNLIYIKHLTKYNTPVVEAAHCRDGVDTMLLRGNERRDGISREWDVRKKGVNSDKTHEKKGDKSKQCSQPKVTSTSLAGKKEREVIWIIKRIIRRIVRI